ncbi:MAG: hypothetical protein JWL84_588 [Rhodospirillales bacterium]|nr:hypothetical protein [Rhodospirillales bacterium]
MADSIKITLAGTDYEIRPLTLGQLRTLGIGLRTPYSEDPAKAEGDAYDRMVANVAAALSRGNPDMTAEAIFESEITLAELNAANRAILEHSGLVVAPKGEAEAGTSAA